MPEMIRHRGRCGGDEALRDVPVDDAEKGDIDQVAQRPAELDGGKHQAGAYELPMPVRALVMPESRADIAVRCELASSSR